ncbi:MAG: hypothetical protein DWG80_00330 [Chloroflexi bacterium]|nr:hypothetical protein [Chloroflexota bacterium]
MEHQQAADHHEEHPPTTIRQYILIGVILAIITVVELTLTEAFDLEFGVLVGLLVFLSAVKFAIVVALFMHLKFDHPLFRRLFVAGLVLASSILVALLGLFYNDGTIIQRDFTPYVAEAHGDEEDRAEGEGTPAAGEGEGTPAADPAAGMVKGILVGEFYQANCAVCHGAGREGGIGLPLLPSVLTQPDEFYHDTIKNGRASTAMPSWEQTAGLTDEDIDALVQFIKHVEP